MKRFVLHVSGFLVATLLAMCLLDFAYTKIYEQSHPRTKFQYLRSFAHKKIDYAFLGSSRVDNGVVPNVIKEELHAEAVNLGFQASKPSDIYTILKLLKEYDIETRQIYTQIDYIYNTDGHSNMMEHEILPFIRDNAATRRHFGFRPDQAALYYVPFYRYSVFDYKIGVRELFMNVAGKRTGIGQTGGYHPLYGQRQNSRDALPPHIERGNPVVDSLIGYARKNQMPMKIYCAPFDPRTKNLDFVQKLKTRIPGLLDYSQAVTDTASFQNYFHLNDVGAQDFTRQFVDRELKKRP